MAAAPESAPNAGTPKTRSSTDDDPPSSFSQPEDAEKATDDALAADSPPADEFPDGGLQAWLAALGAWCCCLTSYGWLSSIGVFQTYYEQDLLRSYSSSDISWILSVQVFALTVAAPFNGKIFDSYGCRWLVLLGSFFHVFGLMMLSLSTEYYQIFLAQSVCSGLGSAALYHGAINATSTWFLKRRGLALGLVASGSSVGGVVVPIMFNHLVGRIGFGWTIRAIAFMFLGLQIIAVFTTRSRLHHVPKPLNIREFLVPFTEVTFLLNAIGCFFVFWGILIPFNYISLAAQASGMSSYLAQNLIPIINGASFFGRTIPPWVGDHIGRYNTAIVFTLFASVLSLALWIPVSHPVSSSNAQLLVFAVLYGIPLGAFAAILPALAGQISPDVSKIGVRLGATFFVTSWAGLTGNPVAGALAKTGTPPRPEDYTPLKIFCGVVVAGGSAFLAGARISQARGKGFSWKQKI